MKITDTDLTIFWFRRDLRLFDNHALYKALSENDKVLPVFIFDRHILDELEDKRDKRLLFIHKELQEIKSELESNGSSLHTYYGYPEDFFKGISPKAVYTNRDYEPYAKERDEKVRKILEQKGVVFKAFKDQVIFEKDEVLKDDGDPYVVYTPYSKKWLNLLKDKDLEEFPSENNMEAFVKCDPLNLISLNDMGFEEFDFEFPDRELEAQTLKDYSDLRNFPAEKGTSKLSIHLRFGTVSIRQVSKYAQKHSDTFLNELIWRNFYSTILAHFPRVVNESFRKEYDKIKWRNNEKEFEAWCQGKTGYPIVDAGMRELNETGYMHNRVRMIVASFLTKHLLIDWRWGEAYFAKKLNDYELASNNGGWQWAAGSGTDAAPYFRIFNPYSQTEKFDPEKEYIKKWIPEFGSDDYPVPIVDHKEARQRALNTYKEGLKG